MAAHYEAIIVGAGPAGGECARTLARAGRKVLLVERNRDFSVNNYSSAGAPHMVMEEFALPQNVIGSTWNKIRIHSSHDQQCWESAASGGVVMDFKALRTFLAEDAARHGAAVRLGFSYLEHTFAREKITVRFKDLHEGKTEELTADVLIDATGCERQVLAKSLQAHPRSFPATGIEYLVEVPGAIYEKYAKTLSIYMGHKWMPQGYSWIFPMGPQKLKVGVGRYFQNETFVPHEKSYRTYMHTLMQECLGATDFPILDKHGKTLVYTYGRKDPHYDRGVIAIGDSVSCANPLAFEGIRHAMRSARIAAKHVEDRLNGKERNFAGYERAMHRSFGFKWRLCELLMKVFYRTPKDENIDLMIEAYRRFTFQELFDLAFNYKLSTSLKFLMHYFGLRLKHMLTKRPDRA